VKIAAQDKFEILAARPIVVAEKVGYRYLGDFGELLAWISWSGACFPSSRFNLRSSTSLMPNFLQCSEMSR
jgi:hypothetical protein